MDSKNESYNKEKFLIREEERQALILEKLRPEINNLLFVYLPEETTIRNADLLAVRIFNMIADPTDEITKLLAWEKEQ